MSKRIYVAGPYTQGDVGQNVANSIDICDELLTLGYYPFCPHLTHFWHIKRPHRYEKWMDYDKEWLKQCDAVLRMQGNSSGADKEVELANIIDIPVYYDIDTLLKEMPA